MSLSSLYYICIWSKPTNTSSSLRCLAGAARLLQSYFQLKVISATLKSPGKMDNHSLQLSRRLQSLSIPYMYLHFPNADRVPAQIQRSRCILRLILYTIHMYFCIVLLKWMEYNSITRARECSGLQLQSNVDIIH